MRPTPLNPGSLFAIGLAAITTYVVVTWLGFERVLAYALGLAMLVLALRLAGTPSRQVVVVIVATIGVAAGLLWREG